MSQPKGADEIELYARLWRSATVNGAFMLRQPGLTVVRQTARDLGIPEKRLYYLLDKWTGNGWWEWGVNQAGGWFETGAPESLDGQA